MEVLAPAIDAGIAPAVWLAAHLLLLVRRLTPRRAARSMRALDRVGVYPLIDHYYEPTINPRHLRRPMAAVRTLPGIDLDPEGAMALLERLSAIHEFSGAPAMARDGAEYHLDNTFFGPLDAGVYYAIIRHYRPRRIIEIGAGMSTLAAQQAIARNRAEDSTYECRHICIEPFEQPWLEKLPIEVLRERMERHDPSLVDQLAENDILFIDSSHVIRPQGDVVTEILEWIGRVRPGVLVHFHDIFTPRDYPDELLTVHRFFWNEQYMVEAFLAFNTRFKVLLPVNHLAETFPERVQALCTVQTPERVIPASLWLQVQA